MTAAAESSWWRDGVLYQIYPRSWVDSNGDGVGDLNGITARLDYLEWLGVDGVWLNPTMPSPNADWGYDVADYCGVHRDLGTLADLDRLVAEAGRRGIRVVLDLVPNHTSDQHRWFEEARSSRGAARRAWYVWADPARDGSPPSDLAAAFGGPAWTLDASGQYYLHHFLPEQPDLNWRNESVGDAFDEIIRFWLDRGIAGFRIDVAHEIVKGANFQVSLPETHAVLRAWRRLVDTYEPRRILLGETNVPTVAEMAPFYGTGEDELHLAFNFAFIHARARAGELADVVTETEQLVPTSAWPVWTLSNHDVIRFPTRWCDGDPGLVRCALLVLLTLRGTPVLYYGDEIGMEEARVAPDALRDVAQRDGARTPMQWSSDVGAGFTSADAVPWLPFGDHARTNVEKQRNDPSSLLTLCRDLVALRRATPDLRHGAYAKLESPTAVWAWRRGTGVVVALNLGDQDAVVEGVNGRVLLGTDRSRDGEPVTGSLSLGPRDGVLLGV